MPIRQFFYFDAIECLPENVCRPAVAMLASLDETLSSELVILRKDDFLSGKVNKISRYYSQEIIFGEEFQYQLGQLKYFLVNI